MGFKEGFFWGGATAANQYEGGYLSGGKGLAIQDVITGGDGRNNIPRRMALKLADGSTKFIDRRGTEVPNGAVPYVDEDTYYPSHVATDFYHHYKEDIAMFAELGFKAFNMTLSWARIFPKGIKEGINPEGVEFYHNVFKECLKYGIEPLVHLYKYDMPAFYIEELGGWKNRFLIEEFVEFGKASIDEFQEVTYWSTFNEINAAQFSILDSNNQEEVQRQYQALHNQLVASAKVVKYLHDNYPDKKIGCMQAGIFTHALTCDPEDELANQREMQKNLAGSTGYENVV